MRLLLNYGRVGDSLHVTGRWEDGVTHSVKVPMVNRDLNVTLAKAREALEDWKQQAATS